jgi:thioredoxin:protein disulfide reductase
MIFKFYFPGTRIARGFLFTPLAAAILIAGMIAPVGQAQAPQPSSVIQPQAYVSLQPVPRGRLFEIAVVANISAGFHVNAHVPSEDYLIPTKITADLPPGIVLVETTYPRGLMRKFQFSTTPLRVYENSFTVHMKMRAASAARIGPQKIGLTIAYQACNQDACLSPTKVPVTAQMEIADTDTPAHAANPQIFSPGKTSKN